MTTPSTGARKRKKHAKFMRAWRKKRNADGTTEKLREIELFECTTLDNILRFVEVDPARPDCWVWAGPWMHSAFGKSAKPMIKLTESYMFADKAVWLMVGNKPLKKGQFLKTKCGHKDCVSPLCLYCTNLVLERARKALALSCVSD